MTRPHYLIGIDLGTTNTVLAYCKQTTQPPFSIEIFPIEQAIAEGELGLRAQLASVRYHSALHEHYPLPSYLSESNEQTVFGHLAQVLGSKTQGRLVHSAKSWLSHSGIDPTQAILPWGAPDEVSKISPVAASASYLAYLRACWDHAHPDAPMAEQEIILTIPASFNEYARSLTLEAAHQAGLPNLKLVEEPQAACYDWLYRHQQQLQQALQHSQRLLVCDIGGGTCDFTLIDIQHDADGDIQLKRIGVGEHLMLGGDNIDLALAHLIEPELNQGKPLSASERTQLVLQCRQAKEYLLNEQNEASYTITLLGRGSGLIKQSRQATLTREQVFNLVLNGFMPYSPFDAQPKSRSSGLVSFGLPYPSDAAISKHLARFLQQHATQLPDTLLLNGGFFQSPLLQQRIQTLLQRWGSECTLLSNPHPDLAVARGAVAYALARQQQLLKIESGNAHCFFLIVEHPEQGETAVCLLPQGCQEDVEYTLPTIFQLRLQQAVKFHLVTTHENNAFIAGQTYPLQDQWQRLPPISTLLESHQQQSTIDVQISARLTAIGTLELSCHAVEDTQRWQLTFDTRGQQAAPTSAATHCNHPKLEQAQQLIEHYFGQSATQQQSQSIKTLRNQLEKLLGSRNQWDLSLSRALADQLLQCSKRRRRSADHERIWLHLTGYCLRPGFGDAADETRIEQLWQLFHGGIQYNTETPVWAEWWNLWRRCAGGLSEQQQLQLLSSFHKVLDPKRKPSKQDPKAYDDMVKLAGALERLPHDRKQQIGQWLLSRLQKSSESVQSWWAIGRLASRQLFHAPAQYRLPTATTEQWLNAALQQPWKNNTQAAFAATLMARKTEQTDADIADATRQKVLQRLQQFKCPASWQQLVTEQITLSEDDAKRLFGESLPSGLILTDTFTTHEGP